MPLPIIPGEVRYLLEVYEGGRLVRSITCPRVTTYQIALQPAIDFAHTIGKNPIRDHDGYRENIISITGTSGFAKRLGEDRDGSPMFAYGFDLFKEFEAFIEQYLDDCMIAQQSLRNSSAVDAAVAALHSVSSGGLNTSSAVFGVPTLVFRALHEEHAYRVEPLRFDPHRSESEHNFTWGYPLQLRTYGEAEDRPLNFIEQFFQSAQAAADTATKFVDQATAYVATAQRYGQGFQATRSAFLAPVAAVSDLMEQVGLFGATVVSAFGPPSDLVRSVLDVADESVEALADVISALPYGDRTEYREDYYDAASAVEEARRTALNTLGQRRARLSSVGATATGYAGKGPAPKTSQTVVTSYTVSAGESLASIAARLLGSVSRVGELAELNQMSGPKTMNDGSPLGPGSVILVPDAGGVDTAIVGDGTAADVYGKDALLINGDWVSTGTDIVLVSGVANFSQALNTRFGIEQGRWRSRPGVGMPAQVGKTSGPRTAGLVASHMRSQSLRDPRVRDVRAVNVNVDGDTIIAEADIRSRVDASSATIGVPLSVS